MNNSTPLTAPQSNALQSSSFVVRSNPIETLTSKEGVNKSEILQLLGPVQWGSIDCLARYHISSATCSPLQRT